MRRKWPCVLAMLGREPTANERFARKVLTGSVTGLPHTLSLVGALVAFVVYSLFFFGTHHGSTEAVVDTEAFYLACLFLFLLYAVFRGSAIMLACYVGAFVLALLFDVFFSSTAGDLVMLVVTCTFAYRLPLRWSLCTALCLAAAFGWEHGFFESLQTTSWLESREFWSSLGLFVFLFFLARSFRARYLLVLQLEDAQARLREEMGRRAELAAAQERARIARDLHDVLAHSLTATSVQVQVARQLARTEPESVAAKLDDVASQLREGLAESRRVVGLLREATSEDARGNGLVSGMREAAERFGERVGTKCSFREVGIPRPLGPEQAEALRYALREALTNAHRHGAAGRAWTMLAWQESGVTLSVRDDGAGGQADQRSSSEGTGNGLRGMRERAIALGGIVEAGPRPEGGFSVIISLPLETASRGGALSAPDQKTGVEGSR